MRQLKLNVEDLSVESFTTSTGRPSRGTVNGYAVAPASMPEGTCVQTCTSAYTSPATCCWTCDDATCGNCPTGPNDPGCV